MVTSVLVTGGAGFVGSHVCKALATLGYDPVSYDNLSRGHREFARWGPLEVGDIQDRARLDEVLQRHRVEVVLHLAAFAYVGESVAEPARYYHNNVTGTLVLLDAVRQYGDLPIVLSSSCAVYGVPDKTPVGEDTLARPVNPYGRTKLMVENVLSDYSQAYGTRFVALRYFNAAGCDPGGEIGEDQAAMRLIPRVLMAAVGEIPYVEIFGTDYPTPDGTCMRDYIHVSDLAQAHVRSMEYLQDGGVTAAINLGAGHAHSVKEIIDVVERVTGLKVPFRLAPRRPGDPPVLAADVSRARNLLGFNPHMSQIDFIVETAWRWFRRHHV